MQTLEKDTVSQLVDIYFNHEPWHKNRMTYDQAVQYHSNRYNHGFIHTYQENGEVLGYYERYFIEDKCFLYNIWVKEKQGVVFKKLYHHFFDTMPDNIRYIVGEKVKLGGKYQKVKMIRRR